MITFSIISSLLAIFLAYLAFRFYQDKRELKKQLLYSTAEKEGLTRLLNKGVEDRIKSDENKIYSLGNSDNAFKLAISRAKEALQPGKKPD